MKQRVDKTQLEVVPLHAAPTDVAYWRSRTPDERWEAIEFLRRLNYGEAACTGLMERVIEIVTRKRKRKRKRKST